MRYRVDVRVGYKQMRPEAGPNAYVMQNHYYTVSFGKHGHFKTGKEALKWAEKKASEYQDDS